MITRILGLAAAAIREIGIKVKTIASMGINARDIHFALMFRKIYGVYVRKEEHL